MSKKVIWHCDNTGFNSQEQACEFPSLFLSLVFINFGKEYRYDIPEFRCVKGVLMGTIAGHSYALSKLQAGP